MTHRGFLQLLPWQERPNAAPRSYRHGDCVDKALTHVPNKPANSSQNQFKSLT